MSVVRAPYDETAEHPRAYRALLRQLAGADARTLAGRVQQRLDRTGCSFRGAEGAARFVIDPVPRVVEGGEWDAVAAGLLQRVEALERFVADVYGDRDIIRAGVVPERVVASAGHHEPLARKLAPRTWITVAGLDLVRGSDGRLAVLEDNLRTPSGLAYLQAARRAVGGHVAIPPGRRLRSVDRAVDALGEALRGAAPRDAEDPFVVLVTDGPVSSAYWEHRTLAAELGVPLVTLDRLEADRRQVWLRGARGRRRVDVIYRRTDDERLADERGAPTPFADLTLDALRAGRVAVANAFGTGVADDKLVHAYVEDMVRFYLGEEPKLPSVRTYDLADEDVRGAVLERVDELVVKPRAGHGGRGVVIGPLSTRRELERTRRALLAHPEAFVAQEVVTLSEHPTVAGDGLAPRHVDLRPFVLSSPRGRYVVPGALTRVALEQGQMIVNSSRNGGAKDTWVLD